MMYPNMNYTNNEINFNQSVSLGERHYASGNVNIHNDDCVSGSPTILSTPPQMQTLNIHLGNAVETSNEHVYGKLANQQR